MRVRNDAAKSPLSTQDKCLMGAGVLLVAAIVGLVLLQGGFFPLHTCACGLVASVAASALWLGPLRRNGVEPVPLLLAGVSVAYVASVICNGATLTTVAKSGMWAACAGAVYVLASPVELVALGAALAACVALGRHEELLASKLDPRKGGLVLAVVALAAFVATPFLLPDRTHRPAPRPLPAR